MNNYAIFNYQESVHKRDGLVPDLPDAKKKHKLLFLQAIHDLIDLLNV
jgi:hypothetical protein